MKKSFFIISLSLMTLLACSKFGVFQAILLLFLMGVIPGTTLVVPSSVMLFIILVSGWLVIFRLTSLKALEKRTLTRLVEVYNERKNNLPKHRFGQVS